jgi:NTP pyrophosphatase (non-canonical NTP hydrolase)
MDACDQPSNQETSELYVKLIEEEYKEFVEGIKNNDRIETLDGVVDTIWCLVCYCKAAGLDFNGAWNEVASSNMSKIDKETGKCIKNEYGKVQKPESYFKPDLTNFV